MPTVIDARTGLSVPESLWGEIKLCWDRNARLWSLHIPYQTDTVAGLPVAVPDSKGVYPEGSVVVGVDEGVINPMAFSICNRERNTVDALVISGRQIRSVKRLRNKHLGSLTRALSKTTSGSRRNKKLMAKKKKTIAKTARQSRNANHTVAKKGTDWVREHTKDPVTGVQRPVRLAVGDLGGFEKNTKKERRANRQQRQQFSQTERGKQETYLSEKTGLKVEKIPEHHTTQTCPKCLTRAKQKNRNYVCGNCGVRVPRDVVGAGNIGSRAENGGMGVTSVTPIIPWVNNDTEVVVTYQRAVRKWDKTQSGRHSQNQADTAKAGWGGIKSAVEALNRASIDEPVVVVAGERQKLQSAVERKPRGRRRFTSPKTTTSA